MKTFPACLSIFFLAWSVLIAPAQTNIGTNAVGAILALVTTNSATATAVTNPPAALKPARGPTIIEAAGPAVFDQNEHWVTYNDNVRVTDSQMKLRCEWLRAILPPSGQQPTNIVAMTNVVIDFTDAKGEKMRAIGDKAVYFFHIQDSVTNKIVTLVTNETVTLTGNPPEHPPELEHGLDTTIGSSIIWNRQTGKVTVNDSYSVLYANTNSPAGTNSKTTGNLLAP